MKPIVLGMALAGGLLWTGCAQAGNAAHGKAIFADQCASCHSATPGQNGIGPSLAGIYGKPAASTAGFNFSPALKAAHIVWNDAALDKFLANPQGDVTGSKMPYMGIPGAADRADVIAYLASLKAR